MWRAGLRGLFFIYFWVIFRRGIQGDRGMVERAGFFVLGFLLVTGVVWLVFKKKRANLCIYRVNESFDT